MGSAARMVVVLAEARRAAMALGVVAVVVVVVVGEVDVGMGVGEGTGARLSASVQSSTPASAWPPWECRTSALAATLRARLGTMAGRSVRTTLAFQTAAAASPTRPVPAPSSRTGLAEGSGRGMLVRMGKRRART